MGRADSQDDQGRSCSRRPDAAAVSCTSPETAGRITGVVRSAFAAAEVHCSAKDQLLMHCGSVCCAVSSSLDAGMPLLGA